VSGGICFAPPSYNTAVQTSCFATASIAFRPPSMATEDPIRVVFVSRESQSRLP
jgi:hypothetical protein